MTHGHGGHGGGGYVYIHNGYYGHHKNGCAISLELKHAPESCNNKLVWQFDKSKDEYIYDGIIPEFEISSRVTDYMMQDFFAGLKTIRNYELKPLGKHLCFAIFILISTWLAIESALIVMACTVERWTNVYQIYFHLPTIPFILTIISVCYWYNNSKRSRREAISAYCKSFSYSRLKPVFPNANIECSPFSSYITLTDLTLHGEKPISFKKPVFGPNTANSYPVYTADPNGAQLFQQQQNYQPTAIRQQVIINDHAKNEQATKEP